MPELRRSGISYYSSQHGGFALSHAIGEANIFMSTLFRIGTNPTIINKPKPSSVNHATDWQNTSLTLDQFVRSVQQGHAFSAHFKYGYRHVGADKVFCFAPLLRTRRNSNTFVLSSFLSRRSSKPRNGLKP
jgi:hypothetical protein